jgi:hypothetical protein
MQHLNAVPTEEPTLDQLAANYATEKAKLAAQQRAVRDAEEALIKLVGTKDEGSFTVHSDRYKVTTTQSVTRKVEPSLAKQLYNQIPRDLYAGLFEWKPSLSVKVYREVEKYQPEVFDLVSKAVTSKAGKPSVKVEDTL